MSEIVYSQWSQYMASNPAVLQCPCSIRSSLYEDDDDNNNTNFVERHNAVASEALYGFCNALTDCVTTTSVSRRL